MFERSAGVLLNVSSLPSPYGIGGFGEETHHFVNLLSKMGMAWWQILPLCPVGEGNSPYTSVSAFAINPLYVDIDSLIQDGYLEDGESQLFLYAGGPHQVDFTLVKQSKSRAMRLAFSRANKSDYASFVQEQEGWLDHYARFMAGKVANGDKGWWEWETEGQTEDYDYYCFEQYVLYQQWKRVKDYANEKGIRIFGDMPIYVSLDSADVWGNRALFQLDETAKPTQVAGVPPDYFTSDGQLWGNPLYNWDKMKQDGYQWWVSRIGAALKLYDAVRIDHFRGFYQYWAVPADATTAQTGHWENGPGMDLFSRINQQFQNPPIIAEDLGVSDDGLVAFLAQTGYPGMRVMQFGFAQGEKGHLPHGYHHNTVAYTGTHDNDTLLGWLWSASQEERERLLEYCRFEGGDWGQGGPNSPAIRSIVTTLWQSAADITILPMQDICGFGTDTRINIPGVPEGNWGFRFTRQALDSADTGFYRHLNQLYGRI